MIGLSVFLSISHCHFRLTVFSYNFRRITSCSKLSRNLSRIEGMFDRSLDLIGRVFLSLAVPTICHFEMSKNNAL